MAEGVEDPQTWSELMAMGCDLAQGYYLGRPMPEAAVTRWLADFGTRAPQAPAIDHPQAQGIRDRPRHLKAL